MKILPANGLAQNKRKKLLHIKNLPEKDDGELVFDLGDEQST